jgi:hypothetical protein
MSHHRTTHEYNQVWSVAVGVGWLANLHCFNGIFEVSETMSRATMVPFGANCGLLEGFGLRGNTCDWSWSWNLSTAEAVLFHVGICVFYAATVKWLQNWVASKEAYKPPSWLESFRLLHNVALALVSFWMFVVMTSSIYSDGRLSSWHSMACQMTPMKGAYGFVNAVYLVSKWWEWVDTYLLVLSQKPVITLHWFHHMTTFTMAALTHNFPVGGFALINCLVHTVMYMHYAKPVRWARPFITGGQLLQFVIVLSIHTYGFFNPATCYDMKPVLWEWIFCQAVVLGFFIMFCFFFMEQYVAVRGKKVRKLA